MAQHREGFSLLEVAVVLLLIGFIGTAAVPSSKMIYRQQTKKLAKEMALDLYSQRKQCLSTRTIGRTYLTKSTVGGNDDGYALSPPNLTAKGEVREKNKGDSEHIQITMTIKQESLPATSPPTIKEESAKEICFDEQGHMVDKEGDQVLELEVQITYNGVQTQMRIDGLTGNYVMK